MNRKAFEQGFMEKCASLGLTQEHVSLLLKNAAIDFSNMWEDLSGAFKGQNIDWKAIGSNPLTHTAAGAGIGAVGGGLAGGRWGALGGAAAGGALGLSGLPQKFLTGKSSIDDYIGDRGPSGAAGQAYTAAVQRAQNVANAVKGIAIGYEPLWYKSMLAGRPPDTGLFSGSLNAISHGPSTGELVTNTIKAVENLKPVSAVKGVGNLLGSKAIPLIQIGSAAYGAGQGLINPESVVDRVGTQGLTGAGALDALWGAVDMQRGGQNIGAAARLHPLWNSEVRNGLLQQIGLGTDVNEKAKSLTEFLSKNPGLSPDVVKNYVTQHGILPGGG